MIRIHKQDYAHLKALSLSERQRLIGLCAELTLYGHGSYLDPAERSEAPNGWAKVASLGDALHPAPEPRWWWRQAEDKRTLLCRSSSAPEQFDHAEMIEFNPLSLLIRSPEQATLRRLMLTEGAEVTLVDAPWGCGLSWGLSMAIADRVQEVEGELLFISREPQVAQALLNAISPELTSRVHVLPFEEAYERCFGARPLPSIPLPELSARVAQISAGIPKHPWGSLLPLLGLLLDHPEARQGVLSALDPLWAESAMALLKQLEAGVPSAELPSSQEWPWPELSCVVVDDALALPEASLRRFLSLAHTSLSDRRRGWRLLLAGRELGYPAELSARWRSLEQLCRTELGKHTLRHQMTQSERLSRGRLSLMSAIGDHDPRSWIERPRRQGALELSHKPKHFERGATVGFHLSGLPLSLDEQSALCRSVLGVPGGCILDFSPQQSLLQRAHELQDRSDGRAVPIFAGDELLRGSALAIGEPSTLVIYAPFGLMYSSPHHDPIPPSLKTSLMALEVQSLRLLLSRTGGRIYWIGPLPKPVQDTLSSSESSVPLESIEALTRRIDAESPWGGAWASELRAEARGLMSARGWSGALERWRALLPVARQVFGEGGHQEALSSLQALHSAAFTESIKAKAWRQAAELARATSANLNLELDEDQSLTLKAEVRALSAEAEEALHKSELTHLERALSDLDGLGELELARPLYLSVLSQLWRLSASHLEAPVPQGPVQVLFLRYLSSQEPDDVEYQCLLQAYEQRPEAGVLCSLAHRVLSQPDTLRKRWALRHLVRWARHLDRSLSELINVVELSLDEERAQQMAQEELLLSARLTLLFATISARVDEWTLSKELIHKALECPQRSTALAYLKSPATASNRPPEALAELTEALWGSWERQDLQERRRSLRALGDLRGLEDSYRDQEVPAHLEVAFELRRALERARGLWRCLTPQERAQLERSWESVSLASPNPKWGIESLAPLDEVLSSDQSSSEGEA